MEIVRFDIIAPFVGIRLSDYLEEHLWALIPSRKGIKKAILRKQILVNQQPSFTGYRLKENDVITLEQKTVNFNPIKLPITVVFEDEHLAIVIKPAGLVTSGNMARTLKNALPSNLKPSKEANALVQPLPIHRLDGLTSGLVLIAKTNTASIQLSRQFQNREVKKEYSAVVAGLFPDGLEVIDEPLEGKVAITKLEVVQQVPSLKSEQLTLLRVFPETGRTHQIRQHLASVGTPILGDQLYTEQIKVLKGKGLFLSAVGLTFRHPDTDKLMEFQVDLPAKFYKRMAYELEWYKRFNAES